jgi:hypothetical protein
VEWNADGKCSSQAESDRNMYQRRKKSAQNNSLFVFVLTFKWDSKFFTLARNTAIFFECSASSSHVTDQ